MQLVATSLWTILQVPTQTPGRYPFAWKYKSTFSNRELSYLIRLSFAIVNGWRWNVAWRCTCFNPAFPCSYPLYVLASAGGRNRANRLLLGAIADWATNSAKLRAYW